MRLCQKCKENLRWLDADGLLDDTASVPESECEFWAHKKLNKAVGLAQGALNDYLVGTPDDDDIVEVTKRLAAIVGFP